MRNKIDKRPNYGMPFFSLLPWGMNYAYHDTSCKDAKYPVTTVRVMECGDPPLPLHIFVICTNIPLIKEIE
jgi:hypothetical protein